MIVTRSWLEEFIDLSGIDDQKLYETFNAVGLEVDSMKKADIPAKVVIGKIVSCEKHPDADKLNVCKIDVGSGIRQIVCGAANVVDAEYVAVATIGAVLPGDFKIKHAKLRGVESEGMVCAASEIGLPETEKGIMILDDSIGELVVGKELREYAKVNDTVIELELTANRGDCLSVYGVARDLSAALNRELKPFAYKQSERLKLGIGRKAELHAKGEVDADLIYKLVKTEALCDTALMRLRLAFANIETNNAFESHLRYATHSTGVILRMYDCQAVCAEEEKTAVFVERFAKGINHVHMNGKHVGIVGVNQIDESRPSENTKEVFVEASYIDPDVLSEATAQDKTLQKDDLYYQTSRGSNPDLRFGLAYLGWMLDISGSQTECYEGELVVETEREERRILVDADEVASIVGMRIEMSKIATYLKKLGFGVTAMNDKQLACTVPVFRHDIRNIQDITEEIVRMVGINQIPNLPLTFKEQNRQNETYRRFKARAKMRQRAVAAGFFEAVTYVFSDKKLLQRYGFETVEEGLDIANPIVEELDTLRTTMLINLLQAVKRNVNYNKRAVALFETGAVFDAKRRQVEKAAFVFCGQSEAEGVANSGKPVAVDFRRFVERLGSVIGPFELKACTSQNALIHPYQSADIVKEGKVCGYVSKLHLSAQEAFDIPTTYIAEIDFEALMPQHRNASAVSNYQGTFKDLSVVVDKALPYGKIEAAIRALKEPLLRRVYPIDVYSDESLGQKHSLTVRFFLQSDEKTLEDKEIEAVMQRILDTLAQQFGATLR